MLSWMCKDVLCRAKRECVWGEGIQVIILIFWALESMPVCISLKACELIIAVLGRGRPNIISIEFSFHLVICGRF